MTVAAAIESVIDVVMFTHSIVYIDIINNKTQYNTMQTASSMMHRNKCRNLTRRSNRNPNSP